MGILDFALPPIMTGLKHWPLRCANESCGMTSLLRAVSRRRLGIHVGSDWYCSSQCFEQAARAEFARILFSVAPVERHFRPRMPLGLVLLSRGEITSEQLNLALDKQKDSKLRLGAVLVQLGLVTERQVTSALAAQWGYPTFSLHNRVASVPVRIPRLLLELYSVAPVHFVEAGRRLVLGFVNGVDHSVTYVVERMTDCNAIPCFITETDFQRQFALLPKPEQEKNKEMVFNRVTNSAEMARLSTGYAVQVGADEARFAACGDYGWVRLTGRRQEMDLLFKLRTA